MPAFSSTSSFGSTDSSLSSCSDTSFDTHFSDRGYVEDSSTDCSQEDFGSLAKEKLDETNIPVKLNGFNKFDNLAKHENGGFKKFDSFESFRNVDTVEVQEEEGHKVTALPNDEVDAEFWLPPEPKGQEDDIIASVANYDDDDDECGDVASWAKPSSLSSFGEGCERYKSRQEKIKAMNDVRNGKFMALVSQLVKSVGVDSSGNSGENWVDIVTSLSWEAAAFFKPDAREGKAMDPDGYVKVKCIASGLRRESRVIKGLVFKKHAAHKHMPTKYQNPRLLLIHGSLDLSSSVLSSFETMQQEKDNLNSIFEMIEMCRPNVILVEKTVSRDIQESILARGMTLVLDMKLHRLERVARCIGSQVLGSDLALGQKLRQCDSFHVTKFVEEHAASSDSVKKLHKTLMFLEGSPNRLGCTILLMGADSHELKKIKCVIRYAVVMAYHLMLETSFLLDQSAMFSTISLSELEDEHAAPIGSDEADFDVSGGESGSENKAFCMLDITTNGFCKPESPLSDNSFSLSFQPYQSTTFPGLSLSTSIQDVMNDSFSLFFDSSESMSDQDNQARNEIQIPSSQEAVNHHDNRPGDGPEEKNLLGNGQLQQPVSWDKLNHDDEDNMVSKDDINMVLSSESILVLMSSRNSATGTICEQSHFSHIKFYRSFDAPLGKFLRDNLLNQRFECRACGESPEVHFYYYAHHNKQLTIQVRQLSAIKSLPGGTEGRLWMWSRCNLSTFPDASFKSTKRILLSNAACGLSFGKFLELSFSNHSSLDNPSSCCHSLQKDFLYFFGLGPMVAMFKYTPVATYEVSLPPQRMDFNCSIRGEFLKKDSENVYLKGMSMFIDIEKSLKEIEARYIGVTLNIQGLSKKFPDLVQMLQEEKTRFEVDIRSALENGDKDDIMCKVLSLNRIRLELLLESCIWDRRIHALLSSDLKVINVIDSCLVSSQEQECPLINDGTAQESIDEVNIAPENCNSISENSSGFKIKEASSVVTSGNGVDVLEVEQSLEDHLDTFVKLQKDKTVPIPSDIHDAGDTNHSLGGKHHFSLFSNLENDKGWIWAPFTHIRQEYMEDLQRGYLPKIESFGSYAAESIAQKLIADEGSRLHLPLGVNDYIVSDYEDEFSSIIACALTLLKDVAVTMEDLSGDAKLNDGPNLTRIFSVSSRWSSFGSSDSDGSNSPHSNMEDSQSSSFDGLDVLDSLVSYSASHPEVSMGLGKYLSKRKYSVVCLYASQFRQLRDWFCPSEIDYIASLSRCRNWDAKGGKSKSIFAKTLDDRFIIKEIKRTEFDSFMKFATNYFDYMNQCYQLGNQTCLAKILGVYQVVIRLNKNGKESRHELVVMENLAFGQNLARQYDLKGALHARFNTASNNPGDVLLDQNFVNDMNDSPLYVSRKSKRNLQRAVYNDTNFLNSVNVMDYSLLVGVDTQCHELACGIIDYFRQYTWDKQLEHWVKSSLVVPKNQLPTIISPKEYKKRFRKFISTYFLSVPDHWCSQRSSNPCKLCGPAIANGKKEVELG